MDLMALIPVFVSLIVIGAFAGFLAGLLGVGGGIVLVPCFFYSFQALGYNGPQLMQVCVATSLATIIVTSIRSLQSHNRKGFVDWKILQQWVPSIAIGAVCGAYFAASIGSLVLQLIFGGLGALIGVYLVFAKQSWFLSENLPKGITRWVSGSVLGGLSVLLGIGGGSLGVPFMSLHQIAIHRAVGTAAGFGLAIAIPSTAFWLIVPVGSPALPFNVGAVNFLVFLFIVPLTFIFVPLGANLGHRLDSKPLKRVFGLFLLLVAMNMMVQALWG
jgi:uncharacterized membrane protein YfcA